MKYNKETKVTRTNNETKATCIHCGKETIGKKHVLNPKATKELMCCSSECLEDANDFLDWDKRSRKKFYLFEFVFILLNLVVIGFEITSRWAYLPFVGMGLVLYFYPLVFTRYTSYERYGIKKTIHIMKSIAIFIVLFGSALVIFVS